jgi:inhibitor of KinA sporulation pathway (predicted exonuclease)
LEWNGAYCKKVGGYFNEIIEIGAVRLGDDLSVSERFDAVIRPTVSRKLTHWVTDLTGYTDEQVKSGVTFFEAMDALRSVQAVAPVRIGDVIFADLLGEADLVACAEVE